jgi:hypothetical protein
MIFATVREAPDSITPGVERSGTPGLPNQKLQRVREAADSPQEFTMASAAGRFAHSFFFRAS